MTTYYSIVAWLSLGASGWWLIRHYWKVVWPSDPNPFPDPPLAFLLVCMGPLGLIVGGGFFLTHLGYYREARRYGYRSLL